ncbi:MAG: hypothetical protein ABI488_12525 [Polyangiaceae bacterium]
MADGVPDALAAFDAAMRATNAPYMIIGGIAVIARGVPRHTDDVDGTVWADGLDLASLLSALRAERIEPRIVDALEFARQNQVFLLRHTPTSTDIDLSLAWLPFEREALVTHQFVSISGVTFDPCVLAPLARRKRHGSRFFFGKAKLRCR